MAKLPAWLTLRRRPVQPDPNVVTFTVHLNLAPFLEAMRQFGQTAEAFGKRWYQLTQDLKPVLAKAAQAMAEERREELAQWKAREAWRREVWLSREEVTWYARGRSEGSLGACRDIRRSQARLALTDAEVIRLQVAACSGEARAWV